jgi:RHS repeat-associated protein
LSAERASGYSRYDGEGNPVMKVAGKTGVPACRRGVRRDRGVSKTPPRPAGDGLGSPSSGLFGGSEKLVEYRSNSTRFFHNDHLGTTKAVTDHTGLVLERWDHYPFGEEWVSGLTGDRYRYTGHLRDQETGNDYAGARYYTNARGRWLSVDPLLGDMSNPQRLNRYSYVGNDPVNIVDPDGREWAYVNCEVVTVSILFQRLDGRPASPRAIWFTSAAARDREAQGGRPGGAAWAANPAAGAEVSCR